VFVAGLAYDLGAKALVVEQQVSDWHFVLTYLMGLFAGWPSGRCELLISRLTYEGWYILATGVSSKVKGATGSAGLAGGVVTIGLWVAGSQDADVPPEVAAAMTTVVSAAFAFVGGYLTHAD
jgi:hypothetical protein